MKRVFIFLLILSCISCSKYGENGDGNGNLKHEFLTEECETNPDIVSWLFLHPQEKTTCYQLYKNKKFTGTSIGYHKNGNIAFISTYAKGEEVVEKRKIYDEDGVLIETANTYEVYN
ncbi:hypothetical protein [Kordia sp.]|uniref:hypothetical protein n=1 Tax=Kordia sp. TaxID=1965332 RepID=UPI003D2CCB6F